MSDFDFSLRASDSVNREPDLIFFEPVYKQMIWGGNRLGSDFGFDIPYDNTGEVWTVSAHPNGDCIVSKGEYKGFTLSKLWADHKELFGNYPSDRFPLLVKYIDALDKLSIQVHPDDAYASINEDGSLGKMECWYVIDAIDGAKLVVGHNAKSKEELIDMINNKKWDEFIREVPVKKGDFIQIDPGTVHAINGGILILETQQNSDITYRVYDYDRLSNNKPRMLHIEKSIDVITTPCADFDKLVTNYNNVEKNYLTELIKCKYYSVWKMITDNTVTVFMNHPFMICNIIGGEGSVNGHSISKKDAFIVPFGVKELVFDGSLEIMFASVND